MPRRIHIHTQECAHDYLQCQALEWYARGKVPTLWQLECALTKATAVVNRCTNAEIQDLNLVGVPWKRETPLALPRIDTSEAGRPEWKYPKNHEETPLPGWSYERPELTEDVVRDHDGEVVTASPTSMAAYMKAALSVGKRVHNECLRVAKKKENIDREWREKQAKLVVAEEVFGDSGDTRRAKKRIYDEWHDQVDEWQERKRRCVEYYKNWRARECQPCVKHGKVCEKLNGRWRRRPIGESSDGDSEECSESDEDGGGDSDDDHNDGGGNDDTDDNDDADGNDDVGGNDPDYGVDEVDGNDAGNGDGTGNDDDYSENASLLGNDGNGNDAGDGVDSVNSGDGNGGDNNGGGDGDNTPPKCTGCNAVGCSGNADRAKMATKTTTTTIERLIEQTTTTREKETSTTETTDEADDDGGQTTTTRESETTTTKTTREYGNDGDDDLVTSSGDVSTIRVTVREAAEVMNDGGAKARVGDGDDPPRDDDDDGTDVSTEANPPSEDGRSDGVVDGVVQVKVEPRDEEEYDADVDDDDDLDVKVFHVINGRCDCGCNTDFSNLGEGGEGGDDAEGDDGDDPDIIWM